MTIMDTIIEQQTILGRDMNCPMVVLAQKYKLEADVLKNPNQIFDKENEFRAALILVPEYTHMHSMMALSYFFKNENNYSSKQQAEIINTYVTHIVNSITPENRMYIMGFLKHLMPSQKRPGKIEKHPTIKALVESKLNENI